MNMENFRRRALPSWVSAGVLAALCCALAFLQYKWIGEIGRAEGERLHEGLQTHLVRLSREFNTIVTQAANAIQPGEPLIAESGREAAYLARYERWRQTSNHPKLFKRVAIALPEASAPRLLQIDPDGPKFQAIAWPQQWLPLREWIASRSRGEGGRPPVLDDPWTLQFPRFPQGEPRRDGPRTGQPARPPPRAPRESPFFELDWIVLELEPAYVKESILPGLLERHLGSGGKLDFDAEIALRRDPSVIVHRTASTPIGKSADGSVTLLEVNFGRRGPPGPGERGPGADRKQRPPPPLANVDSGFGHWVLSVRHRAGSLEAVVNRARWRNLGISAAILGLMLAAMAFLLRASRRAQQLAQAQMDFVAGVSHELRTPLTVIRTAAYNLRGKIAANPGQVERYGALIQQESEKLGAIVEQVLRFASAESGQVIRERQPALVDELIDQSIAACRGSIEGARCELDKSVAPDLPPVLADPMALRHAIQNLINNAVKYGMEGSNWLGVSAAKTGGPASPMVEIRVADRGPGIPADEQSRIFEPFFRGRRAVQDQIHGTGLGLNLVKKIVEAHGGAISVHSEPMKGTEFTIRIPAAQLEQEDEFAHSVSRG